MLSTTRSKLIDHPKCRLSTRNSLQKLNLHQTPFMSSRKRPSGYRMSVFLKHQGGPRLNRWARSERDKPQRRGLIDEMKVLSGVVASQVWILSALKVCSRYILNSSAQFLDEFFQQPVAKHLHRTLNTIPNIYPKRPRHVGSTATSVHSQAAFALHKNSTTTSRSLDGQLANQ